MIKIIFLIISISVIIAFTFSNYYRDKIEGFNYKENTQYFIIESAQKINSTWLGPYVYTVRDAKGKVDLYLNEKYLIGDTLIIVKYHK